MELVKTKKTSYDVIINVHIRKLILISVMFIGDKIYRTLKFLHCILHAVLIS